MKSIQILLVTLLLMVALTKGAVAQNQLLDSLKITSDTVKVKPEKFHSPTKATLFSMVIPGLGQVYNRKYWKVPIIYGGIGASLYFAFTNRSSFLRYKTAYAERLDDDPLTIDEYADVLSTDGIKANMDYHQRNKDLSFIIAGVLYVLNIVDAAVDAHLFNFPKNDNLSFNLQPNLELMSNQQVNSGFKLVINL